MRCKLQNNTCLTIELILVICVAEDCKENATETHRGFEYPGNVLLPCLGVGVAEVGTRELHMLREVVVGAIVNTLDLVKATRELVLNIPCILRIEDEVLVLLEAKLVLRDAKRKIPVEPVLLDSLIGRLVLVRTDEVLRIRLLELPRSEEEIAWRDLVPERLPYLRDTERNLRTHRVNDVLKVQVDALTRLARKIHRVRAFGSEVTQIRLHEKVKRTHL